MSKELDDFNKKMAEDIKDDAKFKEVRAKKLILEEKRVDGQLQKIEECKKEQELVESINFGQFSPQQREKMKRENEEYINAAKNPPIFLTKDFDNVVPFFKRNLILIGAATGSGKSTIAANLARATCSQINPVTGKKRRVLIITNEQSANDFLNTVVCQIKGWSYSNHSELTPQQLQEFNRYYDVFMQDGWLSVIDDNHEGSNGLTTTVEGIASIFEKLISNGIHYDLVILDYYQNVQFSRNDASMGEYEVQAKLSGLLDRYKNEYSGPIVVLAQVNPSHGEKEIPFQYRIQGRKVIITKATCALEIVSEPDQMRSLVSVRKSRFTQSLGKSFHIGYDRGRFVRYDKEFCDKVLKIKEDRMRKQVRSDKKE